MVVSKFENGKHVAWEVIHVSMYDRGLHVTDTKGETTVIKYTTQSEALNAFTQLTASGYLSVSNSEVSELIKVRSTVTEQLFRDYIAWFNNLNVDDCIEVCKSMSGIAYACLFEQKELLERVDKTNLDFAASFYTSGVAQAVNANAYVDRLLETYIKLPDDLRSDIMKYLGSINNALLNNDRAFLMQVPINKIVAICTLGKVM